MKIAVLGAAGGIGQPLSLLLKNKLPAGSDLALYDVAPFTPGVAVDLSHIPTDVNVKGYTGDDGLAEAVKDASVVVIPAGVARKPGMDRSDLFNVNAKIVKGLVEAVAKNAPKACIAIITNPVNTMVPLAAEVLKKAGIADYARKLFGVTLLDTLRAETFWADVTGYSRGSVKIPVIGGHSGSRLWAMILYHRRILKSLRFVCRMPVPRWLRPRPEPVPQLFPWLLPEPVLHWPLWPVFREFPEWWRVPMWQTKTVSSLRSLPARCFWAKTVLRA